MNKRFQVNPKRERTLVIFVTVTASSLLSHTNIPYGGDKKSPNCHVLSVRTVVCADTVTSDKVATVIKNTRARMAQKRAYQKSSSSV